MFSPYGEVGVLVRVRGGDGGSRTHFSLSGVAEYDLRFTDQENQGYFMLLFGIVGIGEAPPPPCGGCGPQRGGYR